MTANTKHIELYPEKAVPVATDLIEVLTPSTGVVNKVQLDNLRLPMAARTQGLASVWVRAKDMVPSVTGGCAVLATAETTAGRPDMTVLDFDAVTDEAAQFSIAFPKAWDLGTLTYRVFWTSTAADTDGVAWGLEAVATGDGDTIDVVFGTPVLVTDDAQGTAEDIYVTAVSSDLTVGGTPAAGDLVYFRVYRDVSDANDDMAEDARLIGVQVFYTTNAENDD